MGSARAWKGLRRLFDGDGADRVSRCRGGRRIAGSDAAYDFHAFYYTPENEVTRDPARLTVLWRPVSLEGVQKVRFDES